ncbi:type II toxin-antitoxin system death-on-curing family toxin [Deinococcus sp. Arct2-2]|uniref:type II toxin-antitoxin system death-on-curing family toxin n=1 Tax=Deinococcus sp. Arct2-2 TaxID=2568653 RepID=UPI001454DC73|nr:type II toxin-antitoxin system death-on-curing family toxin [Deinococcus sp. Arct2-2]
MGPSKKYFYGHRGQDYPTPAFIYAAHDRILQTSPGRVGIAHESVIESAAATAVDSAFGEDAYPTFFTKLAAIGYTLARDHGFSDGNKRTALQVMLNILEENGFYLDPSDREKVTAAILAAMNLLDVAGLRVTLMLWCGIDPADAEA